MGLYGAICFGACIAHAVNGRFRIYQQAAASGAATIPLGPRGARRMSASSSSIGRALSASSHQIPFSVDSSVYGDTALLDGLTPATSEHLPIVHLVQQQQQQPQQQPEQQPQPQQQLQPWRGTAGCSPRSPSIPVGNDSSAQCYLPMRMGAAVHALGGDQRAAHTEGIPLDEDPHGGYLHGGYLHGGYLHGTPGVYIGYLSCDGDGDSTLETPQHCGFGFGTGRGSGNASGRHVPPRRGWSVLTRSESTKHAPSVPPGLVRRQVSCKSVGTRSAGTCSIASFAEATSGGTSPLGPTDGCGSVPERRSPTAVPQLLLLHRMARADSLRQRAADPAAVAEAANEQELPAPVAERIAALAQRRDSFALRSRTSSARRFLAVEEHPESPFQSPLQLPPALEAALQDPAAAVLMSGSERRPTLAMGIGDGLGGVPGQGSARSSSRASDSSSVSAARTFSGVPGSLNGSPRAVGSLNLAQCRRVPETCAPVDVFTAQSLLTVMTSDGDSSSAASVDLWDRTRDLRFRLPTPAGAAWEGREGDGDEDGSPALPTPTLLSHRNSKPSLRIVPPLRLEELPEPPAAPAATFTTATPDATVPLLPAFTSGASDARLQHQASRLSTQSSTVGQLSMHHSMSRVDSPRGMGTGAGPVGALRAMGRQLRRLTSVPDSDGRHSHSGTGVLSRGSSTSAGLVTLASQALRLATGSGRVGASTSSPGNCAVAADGPAGVFGSGSVSSPAATPRGAHQRGAGRGSLRGTGSGLILGMTPRGLSETGAQPAGPGEESPSAQDDFAPRDFVFGIVYSVQVGAAILDHIFRTLTCLGCNDCYATP